MDCSDCRREEQRTRRTKRCEYEQDATGDDDDHGCYTENGRIPFVTIPARMVLGCEEKRECGIEAPPPLRTRTMLAGCNCKLLVYCVVENRVSLS